jgi:hypothetical protein
LMSNSHKNHKHKNHWRLLRYFLFPKFPYIGNRKNRSKSFLFYVFFLLVTLDFFEFWKIEHYRHITIFGFFKFPKVFGRFKNGHKKYVHFLFSQKSLGKWKNEKCSLNTLFNIYYFMDKYISLINALYCYKCYDIWCNKMLNDFYEKLTTVYFHLVSYDILRWINILVYLFLIWKLVTNLQTYTH